MLERYLINHCSPTLASLKTGNLFCLPASMLEEQGFASPQLQACLEAKGLKLMVLRRRADRVLFYLCRLSHLQRDLERPGVAAFLSKLGYTDLKAEQMLARLQQRMEEGEDFPHEIGIFLGYPLTDVLGFIEHGGKNCKCVGCWKVYGDACEAEKRFARFQKCRQIYERLWKQGRPLHRLTVAA